MFLGMKSDIKMKSLTFLFNSFFGKALKPVGTILLAGSLAGYSSYAVSADNQISASKSESQRMNTTQVSKSTTEETKMFNATDLQEATFISLSAREAKSMHLAEFLTAGASLVAQTEPNTKLWYALNGGNGQYAIFDVFPNEAGRAEHFQGQVAAALKENAPDLVENGWEQGVLENVRNYSILSKKLPEENKRAELASYITLKAAPGKAEALAGLLSIAGDIITETEPGTVFWAGMRLNEDTFAIFDTFEDAKAREAHFTGQVAQALKAKADELVLGGWEQGVLENVQHFIIQAEK